MLPALRMLRNGRGPAESPRRAGGPAVKCQLLRGRGRRASVAGPGEAGGAAPSHRASGECANNASIMSQSRRPRTGPWGGRFRLETDPGPRPWRNGRPSPSPRPSGCSPPGTVAPCAPGPPALTARRRQQTAAAPGPSRWRPSPCPAAERPDRSRVPRPRGQDGPALSAVLKEAPCPPRARLPPSGRALRRGLAGPAPLPGPELPASGYEAPGFAASGSPHPLVGRQLVGCWALLLLPQAVRGPRTQTPQSTMVPLPYSQVGRAHCAQRQACGALGVPDDTCRRGRPWCTPLAVSRPCSGGWPGTLRAMQFPNRTSF